VDSFIKTKKFSELTRKIGSVLPFGKLKDMRNWIIAQQYYANYGRENIKGLLLFLAREYGGVRIKNVPPPRKMLDFGIYNGLASIPAKGGDQMQAYCMKCRAKKEMKDAKAITMKNGRPATQGTCPSCGTKMFKIGKS